MKELTSYLTSYQALFDIGVIIQSNLTSHASDESSNDLALAHLPRVRERGVRSKQMPKDTCGQSALKQLPNFEYIDKNL